MAQGYLLIELMPGTTLGPGSTTEEKVIQRIRKFSGVKRVDSVFTFYGHGNDYNIIAQVEDEKESSLGYLAGKAIAKILSMPGVQKVRLCTVNRTYEGFSKKNQAGKEG